MDPQLFVYHPEVLFLQVFLVVQAIQIVHEFLVDQPFQLYLAGLVVPMVLEGQPNLFLLLNLQALVDLLNQGHPVHLVFPEKL